MASSTRLKLTGCGGNLTGNIDNVFSDWSCFLWDQTTDPSVSGNIQWFGTWDAAASTMPAEHLNAQVLVDGSQWTMTWAYQTGYSQTFQLPAGVVTFVQLLMALYQDAQREITTDAYEQITGNAWTDSTPPTFAQAMVVNKQQAQATNNFCGLYVGGPGIMTIMTY